MTHFEKQLSQSNFAMVNSVWPQISEVYGGGFLTSVETDKGCIAKQLDADVGIDFIQTDRNHTTKSYATRMQQGRFWKTFTIRSIKTSGKRTEMHKRRNAIQYNGDLPKYTCHGYVNNWHDNSFLGCGVIETIELFKIIEMYTSKSGLCLLEKKINPQDGTEFVVVRYGDLRKKNARTLNVFDAKKDSQLSLQL